METVRKSKNKYICNDREKLKSFMKEEGFIFKDSSLQKYEYFIDLNGELLQRDSCIRLRKIKDKNIILSFDGYVDSESKIDILDSQCVFCNTLEYDNIVNFLGDIGYYKYVCVKVLKETYIKKEKEFYYSIGVDTVEDIGEFIDYKIYTESDNISKVEDIFNSFKDHLEESLGESIDLKYRDYFSKYMYNKFFKGENLKKILVELDKIIYLSSINDLDRCIRDKYTILNLELIEKLEQKNIDVSIIYNNKDENLIENIKEKLRKIGFNPKFMNIKDIKEIAIKETLIIEKQKKYSFGEIAMIILNN